MDRELGQFVRRDRNLKGDLSDTILQTLIRMASSKDEQQVVRCLMDLGAKAPLHSDVKMALRALNTYALVCIGGDFEGFWRQENARKVS